MTKSVATQPLGHPHYPHGFLQAALVQIVMAHDATLRPFAIADDDDPLDKIETFDPQPRAAAAYCSTLQCRRKACP